MSTSAAAAELLVLAARATRIHRALRALECAALGLLAGAIVAAAGLASGAALAPDLLVVVGSIAVLAGLMTWRERPARGADVARRVDRAARLDGALVAALDGARRERDWARRERDGGSRASGRAAFVSALSARVRPALGAADFLRAALPRSPLVLVAPLVGAALVAFALERRVPERGGWAAHAGALRAAAAASRASGDDATAEALELSARRLETRPASATVPKDMEAAWEQATRQLERSLAQRAASDPARPALVSALAALAADPLRLPEAPDGVSTARDARGDAADSGASGAARAGGAREHGFGAGSDATSRPDLANPGADGRMFGPPVEGQPAPGTEGPAIGLPGTGGPGRGATSARWWPSRYDAVVVRYLAP